MNIVFLDIDGVLNSEATRMNYSLYNIAHHNLYYIVKALDAINKQYPTQVVITSSWRKNKDFLCTVGMCIEDPVLRNKFINYLHSDYMTPYLYNTPFRGSEVYKWLEDHEVDKFVCIDDDTDYFEDQPLLQTHFTYGFGMIECDMLIQFFLNNSLKQKRDIQQVLKHRKSVIDRQMKFLGTIHCSV